MRISHFLSAVFSMAMMFAFTAGPAQAAAEYRDVGTKTDFDAAQNIYFDKTGHFGGSDSPNYWNADTGQPFYENDHGFWWATTPPAGTPNLISYRTIMLRQFGRFRVKAEALPPTGDLYLTLRVKDDVMAPTPVFAWSGGTKWTQLGDIGGTYNHRWITKQFKVPADARAIDHGAYVFKVGIGSYTSSVKGEMSIDRIQLATTQDRSQFPADKPGYWPTEPQSRFKNLGETMQLIPGQPPFFMLGLYDSNFFFTDGGSATKAGHGAKDTWQQMEDAGLNCYVLHGWAQTWMGGKWILLPDDPSSKWAAPGVRVELELQEQLVQAKAHHLKVIPNFLADTTLKFIQDRYHGEQNSLDALGKAMAFHANDPNIIAWYPIDEWDHERAEWGKPHLYSHLANLQVHKSDPNRPVLMLLMGFQGEDGWELAAKDADILALDCYPSDLKGIEPGLKAQGERLDVMRSVLGQKTPFILVPELKRDEQTPTLPPDQIVAEGYMGIIHGARGLLYCKYMWKPEDDIWDGLKRMSSELFDKRQGVASLLLPPSKPVDFMGEKKIIQWSDPSIHASLFADGQGNRTLITLNATNHAVKGVHFQIKGLANGPVRTRFEKGRTLTAADGVLTDDFAPLERHVYDLGQ